MPNSGYVGIYYSNASIDDPALFASVMLFVDELHMVLPIDIMSDANEYIQKFTFPYYISMLGEYDDDAKAQIDRLKRAYDFAVTNKPLVGQCLHFHTHIVNEVITSMVNRLFTKGVPRDELYNFLMGLDEDTPVIQEFFDMIKDPGDEWFVKVCSTALIYAKRNNWQLVTGETAFPIPKLSRTNVQARQLTTVLAEQCFKAIIPRCRALSPEDILGIREQLRDVLTPYRMTLQRLAGELKKGLDAEVSIDDIKREALFLAETHVEPVVFELRKKIEHTQNKLILRVFGKVLGWIPVIVSAFLAPTPGRIYESLKKVYGDVGELASSTYDALQRDASLSYLISADKVVSEEKPPGRR